MVTSKEIGKIFKEARQERDLTVDEAYHKSKIHSDVIKDIESGVFDRLGKLYIKSFMKKYSAFLELDTDEIMQKFESLSDETPTREFNLGIEKKDEKKNELQPTLADKRFEIALVGILSVILIFLIFMLVGRVRQKFSSSGSAVPVVAAERTAPAPAKEERTVSKILTSLKPSAKAPSLILTLKARGKVWLQIKEGDKRVFDGFLDKGGSKTIKADGALTVWTGKAEMLDFIINTRKLGVVANGVIKNITVTAKGVKIGNEWVARLD